MHKEEFFRLMDAPGNSIIPDCPEQEKWLNEWIRKNNRIELMNRIFGAKGCIISRQATGIIMWVLGLFFFVLAFISGFIIYLFAALILMAFGLKLKKNKNGKRQV